MSTIQLDQIEHITIEITSHCNLHCPQCARFDSEGYLKKYLSLGHLDLQQVRTNLEIDRMTSLNTIRLEGEHGDSLMHPEIDWFLGSIPDHISVELVTNASLRSASWWTKLAARNNLTVIFSIDGLADTNSHYRIGSDFNKIMQNAQSYINAGGQAIWKMVVFEHNQHQIEEIQKLSQQMGFRDFIYRVTDRNFFNQTEWPIYVEGTPRGSLKMSTILSQTKKTSQQTTLIKFIDKTFHPIECGWSKKNKIYIDYLGHVIPCCMTSGLLWRQDMSGKLWQRIVGDPQNINLYYHSMSDVLQSSFYQQRLVDSLNEVAKVHHVCVSSCS